MSTSSNKMGTVMATIVAMNTMIGAGIFGVPAALQATVGPAGLITYLFVIVAVWFIARALAVVAHEFPGEGAFYTYAASWGGHFMGMLAAGAYLAGLMIAMGLLGRIVGNYLNIYFPAIPSEVLGLVTLWALVILNMAGAKISKIGQIILIVLTLIPLFVIMGLCFAKGSLTNLVPFAPKGPSSILHAIKFVIFGFFGFESIPSLAHLIKNPKKTMPRAITLSIICVGTLYILFFGSIMLALPPAVFTSAQMPLSQALATIYPNAPWLVQAIHWAIIITIAGVIHSVIWACGSLLSAYIKSAKKSQKELSQKLSVFIAGCFMSICLLVFHHIDLLFSFVAATIVFAYTCGILALVITKKKYPRHIKLLAYTGLIAAGIVFAYALQGILSAS